MPAHKAGQVYIGENKMTTILTTDDFGNASGWQDIKMRVDIKPIIEEQVLAFLKAHHIDRFRDIEFNDGGGITINRETKQIHVWGDNGDINFDECECFCCGGEQ